MEIDKLLLEKGLKPHLKGFKFIATAVSLVCDDRDYLEQVTGRLYPEIAKTYNTTPSKVERGIRHCLANANIDQKNSEFISRTALEVLIRESD